MICGVKTQASLMPVKVPTSWHLLPLMMHVNKSTTTVTENVTHPDQVNMYINVQKKCGLRFQINIVVQCKIHDIRQSQVPAVLSQFIN